MLGGGREKKKTLVDPCSEPGISPAHRGSRGPGERLVTIHYNAEAKLAEAKKMIAASFVFGEAAPAARPLIRQVLGG